MFAILDASSVSTSLSFETIDSRDRGVLHGAAGFVGVEVETQFLTSGTTFGSNRGSSLTSSFKSIASIIEILFLEF